MVDDLPVGPTTTPYLRRNASGTLATVLGLACLALAILPDLVIEPPAHSLGEELGNLVRSLATGQEAPDVAAYDRTMKRYQIATVATGLLAVALLVVARARREDKTLLRIGAVVVAAGLLWEWIVIGVVVAVVLAILVGLAGNS